jgi:hypothetical protein
MATNDAVRGEFYFNVSTGEVEEGKVSIWADRMGPYPTREEAEHALENAGVRTAVWDDDDEARSQDRDGWKRTEEAHQHVRDVDGRMEPKD